MRHVHLSGKEGKVHATAVQWVHALTELEKSADVITLTETSMPAARVAIRSWARKNGWHVFHPKGYGKSETAILSRQAITETKSILLTPLRLRKGARHAPIYLNAAKTYGAWFGSWHTPAHNLGLSQKNAQAKDATRVYISALAGLHSLRLRGPKVIAADWNLNLARVAVRQKLLRLIRRPLDWAVGVRQRATEGGRVIDGMIHSARVKVARRARTLGSIPGFDHKPVQTIFEI